MKPAIVIVGPTAVGKTDLSLEVAKHFGGQIINADFQSFTPVVNTLRIIGTNINQITKKANEINSIYADDFKKFQEDYANLCHTLNRFLSTIQSTTA